jgi:hypothetical protein
MSVRVYQGVCAGWPAEPKPAERAKAGGRGRNRTYNLSVKSRMLCQLSYASKKDGGEPCGSFALRRIPRGKIATAP